MQMREPHLLSGLQYESLVGAFWGRVAQCVHNSDLGYTRVGVAMRHRRGLGGHSRNWLVWECTTMKHSYDAVVRHYEIA